MKSGVRGTRSGVRGMGGTSDASITVSAATTDTATTVTATTAIATRGTVRTVTVTVTAATVTTATAATAITATSAARPRRAFARPSLRVNVPPPYSSNAKPSTDAEILVRSLYHPQAQRDASRCLFWVRPAALSICPCAHAYGRSGM